MVETEIVISVKQILSGIFKFFALVFGVFISSIVGSYTVYYIGPQQDSNKKLEVSGNEFQKHTGAIEEKLGSFSRKVHIEKLEIVERDTYKKLPNENWSGSFSMSKDSISIKIAKRFATEDNYRYYTARARIEELKNENTSSWILVGLPHYLRYQNGFDESSLNLLRNHGFDEDLKEPDLARMKSDPQYRDKMRGQSWILVYFLIKKWQKDPIDLIEKSLLETPTRMELKTFSETLN